VWSNLETNLQEITDGDMFQIEAVKEYPANYTKCTEVAQEELRQKARPELKDRVNHMEDYDVVFLGYPNWWGTCPMPVFSFIDEYNFAGKTIIPFCTHEGSGMGHSESDITKACKDATVQKGLAINGTSSSSAKPSVVKWIDSL
jgi:flavodoxin